MTLTALPEISAQTFKAHMTLVLLPVLLIESSGLVLQLAERMMSEEEGPALQKLQTIHRQLLGQLTQIISSPRTSSREGAVAVAGIGQLAAPTRRFFGQQVPIHCLGCSSTCVMLHPCMNQLTHIHTDNISVGCCNRHAVCVYVSAIGVCMCTWLTSTATYCKAGNRCGSCALAGRMTSMMPGLVVLGTVRIAKPACFVWILVYALQPTYQVWLICRAWLSC